jgi:CxxC motif-containing protein
MNKEFICIVCPRGCRVRVDDAGHITGNQCPRGKTYVQTELQAPTRILTTTVKTIFKGQPRVSCKTDQPIPKDKIFESMRVINQYVLKEPMPIGSVIISNLLNTNANVVLTKSCQGDQNHEKIHLSH